MEDTKKAGRDISKNESIKKETWQIPTVNEIDLFEHTKGGSLPTTQDNVTFDWKIS